MATAEVLVNLGRGNTKKKQKEEYGKKRICQNLLSQRRTV